MARHDTAIRDKGGLLKWPPEPGRKFYDYAKAPYHSDKGCPCEIRGVVDDLVVFRWWRRGSQAWRYEVEHWYFFEFRGLVAPGHGCLREDGEPVKPNPPGEPGAGSITPSQNTTSF